MSEKVTIKVERKKLHLPTIAPVSYTHLLAHET